MVRSLLRTGRRGSASLRQPHPHHRKHLAAGRSRKHQPERIPIRQVDHDEAIRKSLETDTLVVVHPKGRKGVYTGKLFDYLATNKPILAICDPDDVIADLLEETRAGFTADETDNEEVKRMILRCYSIWKNKEVLPRDWDKIRQYSRKNQVGRLLEYLAGQEALKQH